MASPLERVAGFTDPETGRDLLIGQIVEVGRRDGHLYFVAQRDPSPGDQVMDLHAWITAQVTQTERLIGENEWPPSQSRGVRLRCEADRRILARHRPVNDGRSVACGGCGYDGSYLPESVAENINDCPELLDLGHAHGLTPEILAGLDRPQPPERTRTESSVMGQALAEAWGDQLLASLRTTLPRDVPAALRGPNWKGAEGDG